MNFFSGLKMKQGSEDVLTGIDTSEYSVNDLRDKIPDIILDKLEGKLFHGGENIDHIDNDIMYLLVQEAGILNSIFLGFTQNKLQNGVSKNQYELLQSYLTDTVIFGNFLRKFSNQELDEAEALAEVTTILNAHVSYYLRARQLGIFEE